MNNKVAAGLGILTMTLAGCAADQTPSPRHTNSPNASSAKPTTPPQMTIFDPPDPCTLIDPENISRLQQLASVKPKKETQPYFQQCTWLSREGSEGTASMRVAISDLRPRDSDATFPSLSNAGNCPEKVTTTFGAFCQDHERQNVDIMRGNLHVLIYWSTTKLSHMTSDTARIDQAGPVTRQLAEQALKKMPG
ncbi:DUF3558 family protein [Actinoallomurus sp. CA-150999]|uniref:DUF3558 family protein n=1 Tax=Actinoallomurus sp. CA-150999 TaxID=3239887 RepID=UPI003D92C6AE